jgi:hypothetical protein
LDAAVDLLRRCNIDAKVKESGADALAAAIDASLQAAIEPPTIVSSNCSARAEDYPNKRPRTRAAKTRIGRSDINRVSLEIAASISNPVEEDLTSTICQRTSDIDRLPNCNPVGFFTSHPHPSLGLHDAILQLREQTEDGTAEGESLFARAFNSHAYTDSVLTPAEGLSLFSHNT